MMERPSVGFEGGNLEFKSEKVDARDIAKTICAFANTDGGRLFIGITDAGTVEGISDDRIGHVQLKVSDAVKQVSPSPFIKVTVDQHMMGNVVKVEVLPFGASTFCTLGGIVYYRTGSSIMKLEGTALQEYLVTRRIMDFGERMTRAGMEEVDLDLVRRFMAVRNPGVEFDASRVPSYLMSLGAAEMTNDGLRLLNAGILFFTARPTKFIPQAEVRLARFRGDVAVDVIDARYVQQSIPVAVDQAVDFIKRNTRVEFRFNGLHRQEVPEYPDTVIKELIVNALAHRDYFIEGGAVHINIFNDRLEVISPGKLPKELSISSLGTMSVQRNPLIYRLLRDLRLVEGLATGIPRIKKELLDQGYPGPVFEEIGSFFRVTLHNHEWTPAPELNRRQENALELIKANGSIAAADLAKKHGVSNNIAVSDLNALTDLGLVRKVGKTRGARYELGDGRAASIGPVAKRKRGKS